MGGRTGEGSAVWCSTLCAAAAARLACPGEAHPGHQFCPLAGGSCPSVAAPDTKAANHSHGDFAGTCKRPCVLAENSVNEPQTPCIAPSVPQAGGLLRDDLVLPAPHAVPLPLCLLPAAPP